ncbi:MAG: peptide chain release factor N(5)-glutamine methyltransferase [Sulfuritalea sp.]|nr:peptide chain release factor N(5)-glutamine methyltransferase [Sulfuritalea sp.]
MTTVAVALAAARAKLPAGEARLLLGHVLARPAAWLIAHDDEAVDEDALLGFASLVARRAGGEPVAYLVGHREFFGREFEVSPAVLIPRPETELLVELAVAKVGAGGSATILDMGTGSGCIAVTLALEMLQAQVTAVDSSEPALRVARDNAEKHGASLRLLQSDWFGALSGECFDLVVANPPYIAAGDPHLGASAFGSGRAALAGAWLQSGAGGVRSARGGRLCRHRAAPRSGRHGACQWRTAKALEYPILGGRRPCINRCRYNPR